MIIEEFDIVQEIFSQIDEGIVNGYDSFNFSVEVHDGYIEQELAVKINGQEFTDVETDFNGAFVCDLIEKLQRKAASRGDRWNGFSLSYTHGEQVKIAYDYS